MELVSIYTNIDKMSLNIYGKSFFEEQIDLSLTVIYLLIVVILHYIL